MNLDKDSTLKTLYFVGALYRISMRETPNQQGTIDEIKQLISKKIEYDKKYMRFLELDSSFKFTDNELFFLIDMFYNEGILGKWESNGETFKLQCDVHFEQIIHEKLSQGILTSTLSDNVLNSTVLDLG
ncbi:MAG: hypothetical protein KAS71_02790 [Bacteroidales bacterium]|nr:hypothetical protein [Bacteroidales bacterium]